MIVGCLLCLWDWISVALVMLCCFSLVSLFVDLLCCCVDFVWFGFDCLIFGLDDAWLLLCFVNLRACLLVLWFSRGCFASFGWFY